MDFLSAGTVSGRKLLSVFPRCVHVYWFIWPHLTYSAESFIYLLLFSVSDEENRGREVKKPVTGQPPQTDKLDLRSPDGTFNALPALQGKIPF